MAQTVFQTGWLSSSCIGVPDTMIVFNETVPTDIYVETSMYNPIPYCGLDLYDVDIGCCLSSLNQLNASDYLGVSRNYLSEFSITQSIPKEAVGGKYCYIHSMDSNSLFGYQEMLIRDSGKCVENQFICYADRIEIYNQDGCSGLVENYSISSESSAMNSLSVGNISISILEIEHGEMSIVWTAYYPGMLLIPNYSEKLEIVNLVFAILTILAITWLLYSTVQKYIKRKKRSDIWLISCAVMVLLQLVCNVYYQNTIFENDNLLNLVYFILSLTNLGSLMFSITNLQLLFSIFRVVSLYVKTISISIWVLLHFGLFGATYYISLVQIFNPEYFMDLYSVSLTLGFYWQIIYLGFAILPPILILSIMLQVQYFKKKKMGDKFEYNNQRVYIYAILQLLTAVITCLINFDADKMTFSDRQYLALQSINTCISSLNFYFLIMLLEEMANATRVMVNAKGKKQATAKDEKKVSAATVTMGSSTAEVATVKLK
ncbi:hypothetical protein HDV01_005515 [Terramyces sp. JEL0728]|nr:hypothetical protein HDV01_005515 [Terramyces sp. JEL0728]